MTVLIDQPIRSGAEDAFGAFGRRTERWRDVLRRDPCAYCGRRSNTVDHIWPLVKGGENGFPNLTGACKSCNTTKSGESLLHFLRRIRWVVV